MYTLELKVRYLIFVESEKKSSSVGTENGSIIDAFTAKIPNSWNSYFKTLIVL